MASFRGRIPAAFDATGALSKARAGSKALRLIDFGALIREGGYGAGKGLRPAKGRARYSMWCFAR